MLVAGTKPVSYSSALTGLSKTIYDNNISNNIFPPEAPITTTIGNETFTERTSDNQQRILKAKLNSWVIASSIITEITTNAVVNDIPSIINTSLASAVPIPQDGGVGLKTTFATALSANVQKGTIS